MKEMSLSCVTVQRPYFKTMMLTSDQANQHNTKPDTIANEFAEVA
jgi:hypothetical protein